MLHRVRLSVMFLRGAGDVSLHTRFLSPIPALPLPLPSTVWGGLCFTEPTRLCWASGFLATHSVTVLMPNPSGTRALVLLTAGAYLFLRTRGFQMYLPTCHFRRSRFVCIGEAVKIRGVESFVVIIGLNNQLRSL